MGDASQETGTLVFVWEDLEHTKATRLRIRPQQLWQLSAFMLVGCAAATVGAWAVTGIAAFLGVLPMAVVGRHMRIARARYPWVSGPIRWRWGPDGVSMVTQASTSTVQTGAVTKVERIGGFVVLSQVGHRWASIPERAFTDEAQLRSLVGCAQSLIAEGGG